MLKKLKYILLVVSILPVFSIMAQAPDAQWIKSFGGSSWDVSYSVQQTHDGGYILGGWTNSKGNDVIADVYLIKTDSLGNMMWDTTYGGTRGDFGYCVRQTDDRGYIISGMTRSYLDTLGDVYLIKTDSLGTTQWENTFGGSFEDRGNSVRKTNDGGYIIGGWTESYGTGESDVYLIKTDSLGNMQWDTTYGSIEWDEGRSVQQTTDGGYIICGVTTYPDGNPSLYLIKTDSIGNMRWDTTFDSTYSIEGHSVKQTTDEGYVTVGRIYLYTGIPYSLVYLVKADSLGNMQWDTTYGGGWSWADYGFSVQQLDDKGYIISGITGSHGDTLGDVYLIRTDSLGNTKWETTWGGDRGSDYGHSVQQTADGGFIIAGKTRWEYDSSNVYLIKTESESGIEEEITKDVFPISEPDPNPFFNMTTLTFELPERTSIEISIYNMLGQKVRNLYSGKQSPGVHHITWSGTNEEGEKLPGGIYLLKIKAGGNEANRKLILMR